MRHAILAVICALILAGGSVSAHHSYASYATEQPIYVEGDVLEIAFKNPHVTMRLKTQDGTEYSVAWQCAYWLAHIGVTRETFKVGDHLIVLGAPNRNRQLHDIMSLREVRRPSDGWTWRM